MGVENHLIEKDDEIVTELKSVTVVGKLFVRNVIRWLTNPSFGGSLTLLTLSLLIFVELLTTKNQLLSLLLSNLRRRVVGSF